MFNEDKTLVDVIKNFVSTSKNTEVDKYIEAFFNIGWSDREETHRLYKSFSQQHKILEVKAVAKARRQDGSTER